MSASLMSLRARQSLGSLRPHRRIFQADTPRPASASSIGSAVAERTKCSGSSARCFSTPLPSPSNARFVATRVASEVVESAPEVAATENPTEPSRPKSNTIKISGKTGNPKLIAGKIAHSARAGDIPAAVCVGPTSTNIGVKAIAIGRAYLASDKMGLSFTPVYRGVGKAEDGKTLRAVVLKISKAPLTAPAPVPAAGGEAVEMNIRSEGQPPMVGGALAARIREGRSVSLTAIGSGAVYKAVLSVSKAADYLRKDKKTIRAVPEFVTVKGAKNDDLSVIRISLIVEDLKEGAGVKVGEGKGEEVKKEEGEVKVEKADA
ncbi:hypothetical protein PLESTB_001743900 [Pleodorina starrii]|uniref:Uncharacterized protein n=1 Tax=Pleodorina starrii TaxID=330485 RepID=A0A9W6C1C4_9CHLO|nr:hypothetical protein PLESTM_001675500 [Pleodorina starrii]GLC61326.1 hypothetical protein PLESTB_001743900 [Pleodorina starrii]GLC69363.1 hypothetical protein PLESTF_000821000 [Pleodorina starrii]